MEVISETPEYGSLKEALLKIYGEEVSVTDRRAEAEGIAALRSTATIRVPQILIK